MGEVCAEALVAALDEVRAERDALTAEVEKLRAKAARLEARIISRGNLSDDEHQALRRELGDASSEPYEATH